jgi:hypothetical protein
MVGGLLKAYELLAALRSVLGEAGQLLVQWP